MSNKIRWGIISTAGIAEKSFIPALRETSRGELVAVSSRDRNKADAFAKKHDIPTVYDDYTSLLESNEIDAVYNPLPNTMHAEWTIKAAQHGKHIFCEKPLAMSAEEIMAMSDSCEKANVKLIEAFVFLFHNQTLKLRQILDSGVIGDITATHAAMNFHIQRPSDNIRLNKELGGGGLLDGGVYPITFTRFVFGEEPITVQASCLIDPEYGVDTRTTAILEFSHGRFATIQMSMDGPGGQNAAIYGEKGFINIPLPYHPRNGAHLSVKTSDGEEQFSFDDGRHPFTQAIEHFHEVLLDGKELAVPATNALGTLAIVEAIFESAKTGQRVTL
ncbi:MAG: Gfo/Idh/MocA family oxidoreductase [Candidatus Latescibacteria bacterium]|nr:Gfo/Idh/MocA family oxidoreductase [Candidatus Latescibacterota bacterium]MBT5831008.1 Gfo/Idh/MocA family oxidoreductase [Candidatus Latescibacterota bacterium]